MRVNLIALSVSILATSAAGCGRERPPPSVRLVIPTDDRPVIRSEVAPRPISGGTLAVTRDGATAIAADSDRDQVYVVDVASATKLHTVALRAGDEPGRVVEGPSGVAFVALRGAGEVATLDLSSGTVTARRSACGEPRGLAYEASLDALHVACATGRLVTFVGDAEAPSRSVHVEPDLRDVVLQDGKVFVSSFKRAELLEVDSLGTVMSRASIGVVNDPERDLEGEVQAINELAPAVAWRSASLPSGDTVMVHQRALVGEVELEPPTPAQPTSYGGGGTFDCGGIVQTALSVVDHDTGAIRTANIAGAVLPVDVAVSDTGLVAVASAGIGDPSMPRPFVEATDTGFGFGFVGAGGGADEGAPPERSSVALPPAGSVVVFIESQIESADTVSCLFSSFFASLPEGPMVAVAFTPGESPKLIAQSREPAALYITTPDSFGELRVVTLDTSSRLDTGHELFHRDTGAGIACASCHPEGAEDGRVWRFSGLGPRRTQALDVGLAGTAPFHWDGTLAGIDALMAEVFVGRMGGPNQSVERLEALQGWLFEAEPPAPMRPADDPAALRGRDVFVAAGCESCHAGAALTNNLTVDVGTGGEFQVPSLVGIAYRAPFIHDGCAETLAARFDPACGGDRHGNVEGLDEANVADLVAYLETL